MKGMSGPRRKVIGKKIDHRLERVETFRQGRTVVQRHRVRYVRFFLECRHEVRMQFSFRKLKSLQCGQCEAEAPREIAPAIAE